MAGMNPWTLALLLAAAPAEREIDALEKRMAEMINVEREARGIDALRLYGGAFGVTTAEVTKVRKENKKVRENAEKMEALGTSFESTRQRVRTVSKRLLAMNSKPRQCLSRRETRRQDTY